MCCGAVQQESSAVVLFGTIDVRWYWRGKENEKYWGSFWLNVDHTFQVNKITNLSAIKKRFIHFYNHDCTKILLTALWYFFFNMDSLISRDFDKWDSFPWSNLTKFLKQEKFQIKGTSLYKVWSIVWFLDLLYIE